MGGSVNVTISKADRAQVGAVVTPAIAAELGDGWRAIVDPMVAPSDHPTEYLLKPAPGAFSAIDGIAVCFLGDGRIQFELMPSESATGRLLYIWRSKPGNSRRGVITAKQSTPPARLAGRLRDAVLPAADDFGEFVRAWQEGERTQHARITGLLQSLRTAAGLPTGPADLWADSITPIERLVMRGDAPGNWWHIEARLVTTDRVGLSVMSMPPEMARAMLAAAAFVADRLTRPMPDDLPADEALRLALQVASAAREHGRALLPSGD